MKANEFFVIKSPAFVKVTICGLDHVMFPNQELHFCVSDLERFADLGIGETIVIKIEPLESLH